VSRDVAIAASHSAELGTLFGVVLKRLFNTNAEFRDRNRLHLLKTVTGAAGWQLFARYPTAIDHPVFSRSNAGDRTMSRSMPSSLVLTQQLPIIGLQKSRYLVLDASPPVFYSFDVLGTRIRIAPQRYPLHRWRGCDCGPCTTSKNINFFNTNINN